MKPSLDRRRFLETTLAAGVGLSSIGQSTAADVPVAAAARPTLGFSLYGMKGLSLDEAIRLCAEIGYDDVEPALLPNYPSDPQQFSASQRKATRELLRAAGLNVPAMMENLTAVTTDALHAKNLDRIARAAEIGRDLSPERPPILETVLGGKPADWPTAREPMIDRLRDWAETAQKHDLLLAIKPHVGGTVHLPDAGKQIVDAVGSPHLRLVYDFSHYQVQGLPLDATLTQLADRSVFIHVKDGRRIDGKVEFLLPGDGAVDYVAYFRRLSELKYRGSVTVEVSGQIHGRPGYDPAAAARRCYQHLTVAYEKAGLPPRRPT